MAQKIIIFILILVGIGLRIYNLNQLPGGLFSDEVSIAVNAKTIAQNGVDEYGRHFPFTFESVSDYKMPGYIYLTALAYKFFGPEIITVKIVAALSAIISIGLIGYFTYLLFPKKKMLPYYSMAVLALSPYHIHFSRIAYETMLGTTFLLLYFIALIQIIKNGKKEVWFIIGVFSLLLSIWTYPAPRFIIPVFTGSMLFVSLVVKPEGIARKNIVIGTLFFLVVSVLSFIPAFLDSNIDRRPLSYIFHDSKGSIMDIVVDKIRSTISSWLWIFHFEFLFDKGDLFAFRHGTKENGIFLSLFAIPFISSFVYFVKHFSLRNFSFVFLLILFIIAGFPSALTSGTPYGPRLLPVMIPFSVFLALGIEQILFAIQKQKEFIKYSLYFCILVILFYQIALFSHLYFVHFKEHSIPDFPKASTDMGKFVKNQLAQNKKTPIYFLTNKSCHAWGHDDLHLWYFADLNNTDMIKFNNLFRTKRYNVTVSPFDAYDLPIIPRYSFDNIVLFPTEAEMAKVPSGSILIRCGYHAGDINKKQEKVVKTIYAYEEEKRDIFYIITQKI